MRILITGGAGFIGVNLGVYGISQEHEIVILDNLSRPGGKLNLEWLNRCGHYKFINLDITNYSALVDLFKSTSFDAIFHEAAQVAVTTSVIDPRSDFNINALGTFNLLEALRETKQNPVFIYASTNKVYGLLHGYRVIEKDGRYCYKDFPNGVSENVLLDFHSPYGCSKGAAEQYVLDYRRIYNLRTIVFRQSCIYGQRQMGLEDQGWLAWFTICAVNGQTITIYGDGKQVRDVLYIDDLVNLYYKAIEIEPRLNSFVFNVGGGSKNSISLLELTNLLETKLKCKIKLNFSNWRPGDQKVYISDIGAVSNAFEWSPRYNIDDGISRLIDWVVMNKQIFSNYASLGIKV